MRFHEPEPAGKAGGFHTPIGGRRTFFRWATAAAMSWIGLGLAIPLVGFVMSPAFKRRERPWVEVGRVDDLAEGMPKQLDYMQGVQDGWLTTKVHKAVWAVKQAGGQVSVFSPLCTHLGCGYHWDSQESKFKCPCHGSVYDVAGNVIAGPAPRRLDVLPSKIEDGRLLVMYKEFKAGLRQAVEI